MSNAKDEAVESKDEAVEPKKVVPFYAKKVAAKETEGKKGPAVKTSIRAGAKELDAK